MGSISYIFKELRNPDPINYIFLSGSKSSVLARFASESLSFTATGGSGVKFTVFCVKIINFH